jgi:hypothetical protein
MSKDLIQNNIGDCEYFAYPNGGMNDISPAAVREVMNCKYRLGFTTVRGQIEDSSNIYILPRICACENLDRFKFHLYSNLRYRDEYNRFMSKLVAE